MSSFLETQATSLSDHLCLRFQSQRTLLSLICISMSPCKESRAYFLPDHLTIIALILMQSEISGVILYSDLLSQIPRLFLSVPLFRF